MVKTISEVIRSCCDGEEQKMLMDVCLTLPSRLSALLEVRVHTLAF